MAFMPFDAVAGFLEVGVLDACLTDAAHDDLPHRGGVVDDQYVLGHGFPGRVMAGAPWLSAGWRVEVQQFRGARSRAASTGGQRFEIGLARPEAGECGGEISAVARPNGTAMPLLQGQLVGDVQQGRQRVAGEDASVVVAAQCLGQGSPAAASVSPTRPATAAWSQPNTFALEGVIVGQAVRLGERRQQARRRQLAQRHAADVVQDAGVKAVVPAALQAGRAARVPGMPVPQASEWLPQRLRRRSSARCRARERAAEQLTSVSCTRLRVPT
jgi:hypothetical protein